MYEGWVLWSLAFVTVVHGLVLLYAYRHREELQGFDATTDPEAYRHEDGIECPDCGVRNEPGYRFCRDCVAELPGAGSPGSAGAGPLSRRSF